MSNYDINKNSKLKELIIANEKQKDEEYFYNNPDSFILPFISQLKDLGYTFEISDQIRCFMPKNKNTIVPIAMYYYKHTKIETDKRYFLGIFNYKGLDECVPLLLTDMFDSNISIQLKANIAETIRKIRSTRYIDEYIEILSMKELRDIRNPIIALLGDLKVEKAIPLLISSLEDGGNITTNALAALGNFKNNQLRYCFEKFLNHKNKYYRKEAEKSLEKLNK